MVGCELVVDVVNTEGYHDNQPQYQAQNQRQSFFQLLPLVHRALVFFTEDKICSDVKGLDADFRQQELHRLLMVTGDEGDGLLCLALVGLPRWGNQGREPMGAGCMLPRADGVLEVGALGGVVGELDPAEPPESLRPAGRVVPLLQEEEFEGVRPLQPGDLQLRLVGAALALHFGAPRQRNVGLLRDQIHVVAGPHVVRDDELGGEFRHEARRPVLPHHKDILFGVRGEPGEVFNFLLGSQTSCGVQEEEQPREAPRGHPPCSARRVRGGGCSEWVRSGGEEEKKKQKREKQFVKSSSPSYPRSRAGC